MFPELIFLLTITMTLYLSGEDTSMTKFEAGSGLYEDSPDLARYDDRVMVTNTQISPKMSKMDPHLTMSKSSQGPRMAKADQGPLLSKAGPSPRMSKAGSGPSLANTGCQEEGVNFQGRLRTQVIPGITSWAACSERCSRKPSCTAWTWNIRSAPRQYRLNCALMEGYSNSAPDPNTISGPRGCQPSTGYVEYIPGDTNLIITSPHDGHIVPDTIPRRRPGCEDRHGNCQFPGRSNCPQSRVCKVALVSDANSQDVARKVRQIFIDRTGKTPHLIVNQLHRSRMDANRDLEDGAQGSSIARTAHREYHAAIQRAKASLGRSPGLLLDFHMQGHGKETTELGYVYLKSQLNAGHLERLGPVSSVSSLIARTGLTPQEMISGEFSLGAMWEEAGYKAVPSPRQPRPGTDLYYRGGYTVQTHGSSHGGKVDAIQLEMPKELLERASVRNRFANKVGEIVTIFHSTYYT